MKTWFTADTHFDHGNIIKYCNRPFKTVKAMNDTLIRNWNSRVAEHDIVIFLGDFAFKKAGEDNVKKWLSLLHGHITFLRGNHDGNNSLNTKTEYLVMHIGRRQIYCTHRPEDYNPFYDINLVGHVHEKWRVKELADDFKPVYLVNVGVDVWQGCPTDIDEILKTLAEWKRGVRKDYVWHHV